MRILILLLFCMSLFSSDYDQLLLRAQASMYPKIMLLDQNIENKSKDGSISLSIVFNDGEHKQATELKELIESKYKGTLGKYRFQINLVDIKDFTDSDLSTSYYLFDSADENKKHVISHAIANSRICFGYNYKDFDHKILISLFLKEKTYIYINKSVINDYNIKFIPIFYKIAKAI